ncbi:MAG: HypC/HybG/HupF family hydrogenase formation chaperone [candidate division WOR-3 bacterium]
MCLAIPMKLISIKKDKGIVELGGIRKEISLALLNNVRIGDYVIVHAGFAIEKLDKKEAKKTLKIWEEISNIK